MDISCIFNRLLHWIEETQEGRYLVQYDLKTMSSVVLANNLRLSTLAENIEQNCIYIIINETQTITISSVSLLQDDNMCVSGVSLNPQGQYLSDISMCIFCMYVDMCVSCMYICIYIIHTYVLA